MLKASYEVLQPANSNSFLLRVFDEKAFAAPYHFHPEYELTLITSGQGKRYVGAHMADFTAGDLVLLGANLPHCWKLVAGEDGRKSAGSVVIQFTQDFLGAPFLAKEELMHISKLLQRSGSGMQFHGDTQELVQEKMTALAREGNNFNRLVSLLEILQQLALSTDYDLLDRQRTTAELSRTDQERINKVFTYLVEHFRDQVNLDHAAALTGMTVSAFCKYFKKVTRKTFMETVIDYRLNYAAHQLVHTDQAVSAICYDCGFGDISHFNKMFKERLRLSPMNYRKAFMHAGK